ncbi:unnamed protein product [Clavelina lepadiformis]|uniref:Uncharacterized protein n=1 Tax=Clavelina lepadiformis TaxID=159417 RepID=A0ABP0FG14_CLALP
MSVQIFPPECFDFSAPDDRRVEQVNSSIRKIVRNAESIRNQQKSLCTPERRLEVHNIRETTAEDQQLSQEIDLHVDTVRKSLP